MTDGLQGRLRAPARRYSAERADAFIELVSSGAAWSRLAGTTVDGIKMPPYGAPYRWAKTRPDFAARWDEAREIAADCYADRAALVIEQGGTPHQQARIFLALAAKLAPHRWGAHAGEDKAKPKTEAAPYTVVIRRFGDPPDPTVGDFE